MNLITSKTILYSNMQVALNRIKQDANDADCATSGRESSPMETLGILRTTPDEFLATQWELWGDGRRIINDSNRVIALFGLLPSHGFQESFGTAKQIAGFIKSYYIEALNAGKDVTDGLSETERSFFALLQDYSHLLEDMQLVETTEAFDAIEPNLDFKKIFLDRDCLLKEPYKHFFDKCDTDGRKLESYESEFGDLSHKNLTIFRAEGTSVVDRMIYDECARAFEDEDIDVIGVICQDPSNEFDDLSSQLCELGYACTKINRAPFSNTHFGRYFASICRLLALAGKFDLAAYIEVNSFDWICVATDIALNPYFRISKDKIDGTEDENSPIPKRIRNKYGLNTFWRSDRTLKVEDAVALLETLDPNFSAMLGIFEKGQDATHVLRDLENMARSVFEDNSLDLELGAIESLISARECLEEFEIPMSCLPMVLKNTRIKDIETLQIDNPSQSDAKAQKNIVFLSISSAGNVPREFFHELIFSDVSEESLRAKSHLDSMHVLAEKLGFYESDESMLELRQSFAQAIKSCSKNIVCIFPANDKKSDENFTSFCFDELIETVFGSNVKPVDVVNGDLPEKGSICKTVSFVSLGEESIQKSLGKQFELPELIEEEQRACRGELSETSLVERLSKAENADGRQLPVISPTAIENYLACPYKWFYTNVISLQDLDENFSSLEKGSFAHSLLQQLYDSMIKERGTVFFDESDKDAVGVKFKEIASELLEHQFRKPPMSNRYVPVTNVEDNEVKSLIDAMFESIVSLNRLPKDYELAAAEYSIRPYGEDPKFAEYADFYITGTVDRINVSKSQNSYYVLDYKGSLKYYDAGSKYFKEVDDSKKLDPNVLPNHVQALVYASALQKLGSFGNECIASVYASYSDKPGKIILKGSYDPSVSAIQGIANKTSAVYAPFDIFLNRVEDALSQRLDGIKRNNVAQEPSVQHACTYCGYIECERRVK